MCCSYNIILHIKHIKLLNLFCYRSESPSQVFVFTLYWLFEILSQIPSSKWSEIVLAYDNMCQLDSIKVAKKPLPLQPPYDQMWLTIQKVLCMHSYMFNTYVHTHKDLHI